MLEELQAEFLRGLDKIVFLDIRVKILEGLSLQLRQNQPLVSYSTQGIEDELTLQVNPMETYERECKKREEEYMAKTPRQKCTFLSRSSRLRRPYHLPVLTA